MVKFTGYVGKGNSKGVGFIRIPKPFRNQFFLDDSVKVEINRMHSLASFYGTIKGKGGAGVYVPSEINEKHGVIGKMVEISLEIIDGFFATAGCDGRVYIPLKTSESLNLKKDNIIEVSANSNGAEFIRYCRVRFRERKHTTEHVFFFGPDFAGHGAIFKIRRIVPKSSSNSLDIMPLIKDFNYGIIDDKKIVVFDGNKERVVVNSDMDIEDAAYYLGAFFADGTRVGNSWGIVASTFEQARYYVSQHNKLIDRPKLRMDISITSNKDVDKIYIKDKWAKETGLLAESVRAHRTEIESSENRNEFGSFLFKEHRKLVQDYYNKLLAYLYNKIETCGDGHLATDFILGVMEGDGSPSGSKKYGHIIITTNKKDSRVLQNFLKHTVFDFKAHEEIKTKKHYIRINSLSILKNLPTIYEKIFRYYPKRRKKFIERFHNIGAVRFILGKQPYASPWVKAYLRRNKILDDYYRLTAYGKELKKCLIDMENELGKAII